MAHDIAPEYAARLDITALAIARRSTDQRTWTIVQVRAMTREDLALVLTTPLGEADPKAPLARISAPHHFMAKLLAQGKEPVEVSRITGYTPARINTLLNDPCFSELIAHYEAEVVAAEADIQAQIQHIALTAGQLLQERLEDNPEAFSTKDLQSLFNSGLDRIGHGPGSKVQVNVNDPAKIIDTLKESLSQASSGRVISKAEVIDAEFAEPQNDTPTPRPGPQEG